MSTKKSKKPSINWKQAMIRRGHAPLPRYGAYHVMLINNLSNEYSDPLARAFHAVFTALSEYIHERGGHNKYVNYVARVRAEYQQGIIPQAKYDKEQRTLALYKKYKNIDWSTEDPVNHGEMMREAARLYCCWWT